jgi:hypothetical protein
MTVPMYSGRPGSGGHNPRDKCPRPLDARKHKAEIEFPMLSGDIQSYGSAYVALWRKLPPLELAGPVGLGA